MSDDMKTALLCLSFLSAIGAGVVVSVVVHEAGHSAACSYFGYDSPITINLTRSYASCEAVGMELTYVRMAGGGLAAAVFLPALIPAAVRRNNHARMFFLVGGITHAINMLVETLVPTYNDLIIHIPSAGIILLWPTIVLIIGVVLTVIVERDRFPRKTKPDLSNNGT